MSYNGSGVYTLPGAQLANGATVSATENNQFRNDVATALNVAWTRDGQAPATNDIPMGSHKLTGLAAGTGVGDSVRYEQLPSATNKLDLTTSVTGALPIANGGTNATSAANARTSLGLAIGTDVQAYAAELQGATQGGINGFKNRIINGAMMIDQRNAGASQTITTGSNIYTVDRWFAITSGANVTGQQITGAVANTYRYRFTGASSNTSIQFVQRIEAANCADLAGQSVTVSFDMANSLLSSVSYRLQYASATDNWGGSNTTIVDSSVAVTSTVTRYSFTVSIPAGATTGLQLIFYTGAQTSGTWTIGNVQLEKGSTATSFDYRPYGTELALAQRYYQTIFGLAGTSGAYQLTLPVQMRSVPTITSSAGTYGNISSMPTAFYNTSTVGFQGTNLTFSSEL